MKDVMIVPMRAQPFHEGHAALIDSALTKTTTCVVVVLCGPEELGTVKDPFPYELRREMMRATFPAAVHTQRLLFIKQDDMPSDADWKNSILQQVKEMVLGTWHYNIEGLSVGVAASKKEGDDLLRHAWFGDLPLYAEVPYRPVGGPVLSATDIRKDLYQGTRGADQHVPPPARPVLRDYVLHNPNFKQIAEEANNVNT